MLFTHLHIPGLHTYTHTHTNIHIRPYHGLHVYMHTSILFRSYTHIHTYTQWHTRIGRRKRCKILGVRPSTAHARLIITLALHAALMLSRHLDEVLLRMRSHLRVCLCICSWACFCCWFGQGCLCACVRDCHAPSYLAPDHTWLRRKFAPHSV
jgi:hypothetical protein